MEGLEALVQAATQERQRLDGEKVEEVFKPSSPSMWSSKPASPAFLPDHTLAVTMVSSAFDDGPSGLDSPQNTRVLSSPSQPYRSPIHTLVSPTHHLASSLDEPSTRPSPQRNRTLDIVMSDAEIQQPPPKRRRSSERPTQHVHALLAIEEDLVSSLSPADPNAMEVEQDNHARSDSHAETALLSEIHPLEPAQASDMPKFLLPSSPMHAARAHDLGKLPSPSPTPVSPLHPPLHSTVHESADSNPSGGVAPKLEAIDSPVVLSATSPMVESDLQVQESKPKAKKKKSDGTVSSKSKERVKHKEKGARSKHATQSTPSKPLDSGKEDDTDDWFLEQFGEAEPKVSDLSSDVKPVLSSSHRTRTPDGEEPQHRRKPSTSPSEWQQHVSSSKMMLDRRSRSPTPLEMLEAELDDVPLVSKRSPSPPAIATPQLALSGPGAQTMAISPADLDLDTELERTLEDEPRMPLPPAKPKPKPRPKAEPKSEPGDTMDLDVEDELLALLDDGGDREDKQHRLDPTHSLSSDSNLHREVVERGRGKHPARGSRHDASAVASPALEASSLMPPPDSRGVSQVREGSTSWKDKDEREAPSAGPTSAYGTPVATPTPTPTPGPSGASKGKEGPTAAVSKASYTFTVSSYTTNTWVDRRRLQNLEGRLRLMPKRNPSL